MNFQPVIPAGGLVGWRFLQRTYTNQLDAFSGSPQMARDSRYFLEKIPTIKSAEDLVSDRQLLQVALGAFGLEEDINNTYFIRKVLEDGTQADDALANRLSDQRYRKFSAAFGFGPGEAARTGIPVEMSEIARKNLSSRFEISVGEADNSMRVALYAQRELPNLAAVSGSEDARWFRLMSVPPLREMMETALGLPSSFAQLDIDKQLEVFKDRLSARTGSSDLSQFTEPAQLEELTNTYLAQSQISSYATGASSASIALTLLRQGG